MWILTRYAVFEFLKVFALALAGITAFMLLIGVATQAVREGLSLGPILRLLPFIVPESMRFSVPAAALLAACIVYGRMAGDNEIVALKSAGISPWSTMAPVTICAFLFSVVAVWVNDVAVSWGRPGISRVVTESIEQIAYGMLRSRRSYSCERFSITVKDVQGKKLILPTLTFHGRDGTGETTVSARFAELRHNPEENSLSIFLTDTEVEGPGNIEGAFPGTVERVISWEPPGRRRHDLSPSDYPLRELGRETERQAKEIEALERRMAALSAFQLLTGDLDALANPKWQELHEQLDQIRYRRNRLRTEPWRRWANGFSCFFFVLVGIPLSIRLRNSDFVTSFFASFAPILLVYYPLMTYGVDRAKEGALPQYAVWLGNAVCLAWAAWLTRRVLRY
jgi:lipopolysaccharide export system permease protein